ncbi:MAG: ABC transporter permease, partial [Chloroflexota bacterium]
SQQTASGSVRALPPDYPAIFGALVSPAGQPLSLAGLRPGEMVLNEAARVALAAQVGDQVSCTVEGVPLRWRVAAVAGPTGLGAGAGASAFVPLAHLQAALGPDTMAGVEQGINQIWIANQGDAISSAARTERVTDAIRPLLIDPAALQELRQVLSRDDLRAVLAARRGSLPERTQAAQSRLLRLVDEPATDAPATVQPATDQPATVEALGRALRSRSLRAALLAGAQETVDAELLQSLSAALQRATGFQVYPLKQQVLEIADRAGNVITTIFLLFSLLSIAAALLLVFLIFSLLAASRRSELGITRALGTERGHLIAMFTFEGVAYALLAAVVGLPVGLAISRLLLTLLLRAVESGAAGFTGVAARVADTVSWHAEPHSAALAVSLGLLLTVITVVGAAWQVSRVTIVTAIRDLPEPPPARPAPLSRWWIILLPAAVGLIAFGLWWGETFPFAAGVSCLALFAGDSIGQVCGRLWGRPSGRRAGATVAGIALAGYWALPFDAQQWIGLPRLSSGIEIFGLAGVLMVAGAAWALSANGDLALRAGTRLLTALGHPAPALRLAAAHLFRNPFRTGVTITMFALVVFMLTVMQVITAAATHFQANPVIAYGGWDVRGQLTAEGTSPPGLAATDAGTGDAERGDDGQEPSQEPARAEAAAEASSAGQERSPEEATALFVAAVASAAPAAADKLRSPEAVALAATRQADLEPFIAAAGVRTSAFFATVQLSAPSPSWGGYTVAAIDEGFARGNEIPLQTRARGYTSDQA